MSLLPASNCLHPAAKSNERTETKYDPLTYRAARNQQRSGNSFSLDEARGFSEHVFMCIAEEEGRIRDLFCRIIGLRQKDSPFRQAAVRQCILEVGWLGKKILF